MRGFRRVSLEGPHKIQAIAKTYRLHSQGLFRPIFWLLQFNFIDISATVEVVTGVNMMLIITLHLFVNTLVNCI